MDNGHILTEWQTLNREYTGLGLSNHQTHKQIAENYHCSIDAVRYWLRPDVRTTKLRLQKKSRLPYSKDPKLETRRLHSRIYNDIRRFPAIYLKKVYCGRDTALSLDEITTSLARLTGIELRNNTLLKVVADFEKKHGKKLLVENGNQRSPVYRLHYKNRSYGV
jgi:hypothetical protein